MLRFVFLFCCFVSLSWAEPCVEMFLYWMPHAEGQDVFPKAEGKGWDELGLFAKIRRVLDEKGIGLRSWELEKHRSELLAWRGVHSLGDFWLWLWPKRVNLGEAKWVFWSFGPTTKDFDFSRVSKEKLVLLLFEPPTVEPRGYDPEVQEKFGKILTWDDDLVDGKKFVKYYYPELKPRIAEVVPFEEKKFCVMLATRRSSRHPKELYSERERVIRFFENKPGELDLYGWFWEKRRFVNWKGRAPDKLQTVKQYKFSICYENMGDVRGYVTEKIFDCFAAGNVPIYLGASNIEEYVPADCFIDRRKFSGEEELYRYLKSMSREEYEGYLERAAAFIKSEKAQLFSSDNFVKIFTEAISF